MLLQQRQEFEDWCSEAQMSSTGREGLAFQLQDSAGLAATLQSLLRNLEDDLWGKNRTPFVHFYTSRTPNIVVDEYQTSIVTQAHLKVP